MIKIKTCNKDDKVYGNVCELSKKVYKEKQGADLENFPELFVFAKYEDKILGCFGLRQANKDFKLLLETYLDFDVLEKISGKNSCKRNLLGEICCRTVYIKSISHTLPRSASIFLISAALAAAVIIKAEQLGIEYLVFTASWPTLKLTKMLGIDLWKFGKPNLAEKSQEFKKNWSHYFEANQECYGFKTSQAIPGCVVEQKRLSETYGYQFSIDENIYQ